MTGPLACFPMRVDWELVRGEVAAEPYPTPAVSSRDADALDGVVLPGPVAKLAQSAAAAGWEVRVQRSVGCMPHATHGRPGAEREAFAVRGYRRVNGVGRRFCAVRRGAGWECVWMWGPGIGWFGYAGVTDLAAYLADPMRPAEWFNEIRMRRIAQERRAKEAAAARPKKAKTDEGM